LHDRRTALGFEVRGQPTIFRMSSWNALNAQAGSGFWECFAGTGAPAAAIYGASIPGGSKLLFPQPPR